MTNDELNEKIRQACTHAAPDVLDAVLSDCNEQKGRVILMTTENKKKTWAVRMAGLAAGLCLILGGGLGVRNYQVNHTVDATVSLDVNPSVEIKINQKERILDVIPLNEDGRTIVGDMDFSGSSLDVAVNAIIGSMLQNGYLNELANSVLISVDNNDPVRGMALQERLADEVNKLLQTDSFRGAVLSQTVVKSDELQQMAEQYGITLGKAQLIQAHSRLKIVWVHPGIKQDKFGYGCMKLFCKFVQRVSFLYTITDSILTIHIFFHKNIFRLFYEILRVWLPNWNHLIIPLLIEFDNRSCGCINFIAVLIASSFKFNLINRHAIIPIQFSLHLKSIGTCNTGMG
jgi:hypothetical protein